MRFPYDAIEWWQYFFLVLALFVWPALYVRSCSRLTRDRKRAESHYLAHFVAFGAGGSWLLSIGLISMPMLAVLCIMFSMLVSFVALVLAAVAFHPPSRYKREPE